MAKIKFLSPKNVLTSLKAIVISILTILILIIPQALAYIAARMQRPAISMLIGLIVFIAGLWIWGYLATRMWGWK